MPNPLRFHVLLLPNVGWAELKARVALVGGAGARGRRAGGPRRRLDESDRALARGVDRAAGPGGGHAHDPALDRRQPDPAAQPGDAGSARSSRSITSPTAGSSSVWARGSAVDPSSAMIGVPNWEPGERVAALRGVRRARRPVVLRGGDRPTRGATTRSTARSGTGRCRRRARRSSSPPSVRA